MVLGGRGMIFCIWSEMSAYMVVLPDRTLLALRSLWMLISHFMMELNVVLFGCTGFRIQEGRLEESLKATEPLVANSDDLAITSCSTLGSKRLSLARSLQQHSTASPWCLALFPTVCDGETVTRLSQNLHEVICEVIVSQVQMQDGIGRA